MRYFGSKGSTTERIYELLSQRVPSGTFCDPFGGIATVASCFKAKGYAVWSGDILTFAHYFQIARLQMNCIPPFELLNKALHLKSSDEVVALLNRELPKDGWIVEEYARKRRFFTEKNGGHIEACRLRINEWSKNKWLTRKERAVLMASLINCMDKVANTAGTYYAYLKAWHRKALLPFRFELVPYTAGNANCYCFLDDAQNLVARRFFDIIYLDPPYNERNYAQYYHLPETIALGGTPETHGESGMSNTDKPTSDFNKSRTAKNALEQMLRKASFRVLAFHYSDDGLIRPQEIKRILSHYGRVEDFNLNSKGYTTSRAVRTVKHHFYLVNYG